MRAHHRVGQRHEVLRRPEAVLQLVLGEGLVLLLQLGDSMLLQFYTSLFWELIVWKISMMPYFCPSSLWYFLLWMCLLCKTYLLRLRILGRHILLCIFAKSYCLNQCLTLSLFWFLTLKCSLRNVSLRPCCIGLNWCIIIIRCLNKISRYFSKMFWLAQYVTFNVTFTYCVSIVIVRT